MFLRIFGGIQQASVELVGAFTPEEAERIRELREQFHCCPDRYRFDFNYKRLDFVRWLVKRGLLDDGQ